MELVLHHMHTHTHTCPHTHTHIHTHPCTNANKQPTMFICSCHQYISTCRFNIEQLHTQTHTHTMHKCKQPTWNVHLRLPLIHKHYRCDVDQIHTPHTHTHAHTHPCTIPNKQPAMIICSCTGYISTCRFYVEQLHTHKHTHTHTHAHTHTHTHTHARMQTNDLKCSFAIPRQLMNKHL